MFVGGMFTTFDIAASGLRAERARMNVVANNMANVNTTHNRYGDIEAYRRQRVFFKPGAPEVTGSARWGVSVEAVKPDYDTQLVHKWDPEHPDAVQEGEWKGYVAYPNIHAAMEMVDMMVAARAYEANLTSMESAKQVHRSALQIIA